ncbi:MAG TPA: MarR family transcriptional regulator [Smithellaceae bacterium]|nr:MarR family transcriptional regulator [Smithellaceae bacterium]
MNEQYAKLMEVFTGMAQVTRYCRQDVAFCEGVTFHQFMILDAVAKREVLPMNDLHGMLAVEKSTTTRLVNPLLQKGLLKRDKSPRDSRAVTLFLTPEGRKIQQRVARCLAAFFQKINGNIPAGREDEVLEAIGIFISAIKNAAAGFDCCGTEPTQTGGLLQKNAITRSTQQNLSPAENKGIRHRRK